MRTTIDLPVNIRQKLISEAASRNLKGFSKVIIEALEQYFKFGAKKRKAAIQDLKGCLSKKEYLNEMKRVEEEEKIGEPSFT